MTANLVLLDTGRTPPAKSPREMKRCIGDVADWQDMLCIGWDTSGALVQRSTKMTRAEALMLVEQFKKGLLG